MEEFLERLRMIQEVKKVPVLPTGTFISEPEVPTLSFDDLFETVNCGFGPTELYRKKKRK